MRIPEIGTAVAQAERAEAARLGRHHVHRLAEPRRRPVRRRRARAPTATERLRFATGVTNAFTRHPAALANVAATVQETSGGRFVLGIGRGDTALFHLGRKPDAGRASSSPRSPTCRRTSRNEHGRLRRPPEPVAVARPLPAAEGAARHRGVGPADDRVRGAHRRARHARGRRRSRSGRRGRSTSRARPPPTPDAIPAEISFGAYVNVGCHPDLDAARGAHQRRGRRVRALLVDAGLDRRRACRSRPRRRRRGRSPLRQQRAPEQRGRAHRRARTRLRRPLRGRRPARRVRASVCTSSPGSASIASSSPARASVPTASTRARREQLLTGELLPALRERSVAHERRTTSIIRGGTVVDGTGAPARTADVAIDGGVDHRGRPGRRRAPRARSTPTACSSRPASSTSTRTTTARRRGASA